MNTIIEEIRNRIKAAENNIDAAGDYDEYADGRGVGLATALGIIDEVEKEHPIPEDVQEAAKAYSARVSDGRHFRDLETGYADGMLAERERQENEAAYFPEYDSIVNKVFGAGNLDGWELNEAERLVRLARAELLKDLASLPTIKGWVMRDKYGSLKLYEKRPHKIGKHLCTCTNYLFIKDTLFPDLREDEPKPVRVIIEEIKE